MTAMNRYYRLKQQKRCVICSEKNTTENIYCIECGKRLKKQRAEQKERYGADYKLASHICPVCKKREKKYRGKCYICYGYGGGKDE